MFTVLLARWYWDFFRGLQNQEVSMFDEEFGYWDISEAQIDPGVKSRFQSASSYLPIVINRLESDQILQFYALYKQATVGPAKPNDRPSFLDVKGKSKYDAWAQLNGMSKSVAMETYVAKMEEMNLGWDPNVQRSTHGFGIRPSCPAVSNDSSEVISMTVTDREALQWFTAAKCDDLTTIMHFFERRPELLNQTDQHLGMTALHWAVDSGCENVVRYLLSKNVDINAVDLEGNTPLHFAALCGRREAAEILICKGADRTLRNCDGQIPAEVCDDPMLREILTPPSLS